MRRCKTSTRWELIAALTAAFSLVLAAGALGANPRPGKLYTGPTSASYNGFTAPVSFRISKNGRQLLSFKWAGGGCIGLGGPGNAWSNPAMNYKVGTINVSRTGTFSVKNVKSTVTWKQGRQAFTKVTTSTVAGRFKTATTATGTISFTMKITKPCSGKTTFTATLGPAAGALHKLSPATGTSVPSSTPTLNWSASANATAYRYCIATSENGPCIGGWVSTGASTHATLRALQPGSYHWQVIASSVHGTVAADNGGWSSFTVPAPQPIPNAGYWEAGGGLTGASGNGAGGSIQATNVFFLVSADRASVSEFGFAWDYSGPGKVGPPFLSCSGSRTSSINAQHPSPITNGQFSAPSPTGPWSGSASGDFHGTFDSATSAHGTATLSASMSDPNCFMTGTSNTGTFNWTATWQH
jgi:hypothetical protein